MSQNKQEETQVLFGKKNYFLVLAGLVPILLGYFLMIGGGNPEPEVFNAEEKYSFVRITLSPILILLGLLIEGVAIFVKR